MNRNRNVTYEEIDKINELLTLFGAAREESLILAIANALKLKYKEAAVVLTYMLRQGLVEELDYIGHTIYRSKNDTRKPTVASLDAFEVINELYCEDEDREEILFDEGRYPYDCYLFQKSKIYKTIVCNEDAVAQILTANELPLASQKRACKLFIITSAVDTDAIKDMKIEGAHRIAYILGDEDNKVCKLTEILGVEDND